MEGTINVKMLDKILRIRFLQIKRSLQDLSVLHVIALVIILSGIGLSVAASFTSQKKGADNSWILAALTAVSFLSLQFYRPDKKLISIIAKQPFTIFGGEYLILSLPILGFLIYLKNLPACIGLILALGCIGLINKNLYQSKGVAYFSKIIPSSAFEWRGGMRKMGLIILFFNIVAVVTSGIRVVPFVSLFFGLSLISQFFYECEPLSILSLTPDKAAVFLRKKIGQSLLLYSIITLPIVFLASVLVPDLWFLGLAFYVLASVNIANFILMKYAFYHPNSMMNAGSALSSIGLLGSIVPFFAPVPLILLGWYYFQAHKKLKYYLND
jgi:hypothetical protein